MTANGPHKILFVINKRSGRKKTDREPIIREFMAKNGLSAAYFDMPKRDCALRLKEAIAAHGPNTVVAVGGDGTVSLVAGEILGKGMRMGIVPAGSANGMARELEIPEDTLAALEIIKNGTFISSDLVQVNNSSLCMHLSDLGLNARVIKYFEEGPLRGLPGYALALVKALRRKTTFHTVVETKEGVKEVEAMMLLFANAGKYGTGATINHESSLTDGLFEVVIVKKIGAAEIWNMFFGRRGFNPQNIELLHARSVKVETMKPTHLQVDGEYLGKVTSVHARVLEDKLDVFVPRKKKEAEHEMAEKTEATVLAEA